MIVILDNIRSAHNVGSIIRTCDALGIKEVAICGLTPGYESPKVQKTSLGAETNITFKSFPSTLDAVHHYKGSGSIIVSLELDEKAVPICTAVTEDKQVALVVGNEVSGVSSEVIRESDIVVQIPMKGIKESLNVSVAFGIAAYTLSQN